jgi:hypothetical protein
LGVVLNNKLTFGTVTVLMLYVKLFMPTPIDLNPS